MLMCAGFAGVPSVQLTVYHQANRSVLWSLTVQPFCIVPGRRRNHMVSPTTEGGKSHCAEPKQKSRDVRQTFFPSSSDYVTKHSENKKVPVT